MSYPQFDGFRLVAGQDLCDLRDRTEVYVQHKDGHLVKATKNDAPANSDWSTKITVSEEGRYKRREPTSWGAEESFYISEGGHSWFCQAWVREEATVEFTAGDVIEVKSQQGVWCKFVVVDEPDSDGDIWVSNYVGQDYGDNEFVFWSGTVTEFDRRSGTLKVAKNEIRLVESNTPVAEPAQEELSWESLGVGDVIEVQDTSGDWHLFEVEENQVEIDGSFYARNLAAGYIEIDGRNGTKDIGAGVATWIWRSENSIRLAQKASVSEPEVEEQGELRVNWADLRFGQWIEVKDIRGNWVECIVRENDFDDDESIYVQAEADLEVEDRDGDEQYVDAGDYVWIWFEQHEIRLPKAVESEQAVVALATVQAGDKVEILSQEGNWVVAEVCKNDWNRDQSLFVIVSEEGTFKAGMGDRRSLGKGCGFWAYAETNTMRLHSVAPVATAQVTEAAETPEQEIARLQARLTELRRLKAVEDSRETLTLEWCGIDDGDTYLEGEFYIRIELDGDYLDSDGDLSLPGYANTRNIFRRVDN